MMQQMAITTQEMTLMDESQIEDILKRLGFFYVHEVDSGSVSDFHVGHIPTAPFVVLSRSKATGVLSGPYADLVQRVGAVVSRYIAESDDVIMLPSGVRQGWIADLARQAQLTTAELQSIVSSGQE
jgi:hypothetical protein